MPNISIIIPAYNGERYLSEAIDSVLNQTYKDFELVIIDDGSTDNTSKIIRMYTDKYGEKIRYFYQKNGGVAKARNRGIQLAKGNYYSFLDQDDYFLPLFLELCLKYLENNNFDFVIPKYFYKKIYTSDNEHKLLQYIREDLPGDSQELYMLLFKKFVGCIKMLAKKTCFNKCGNFDENFLYHDDWEIWVRFTKAGLRAGLVIEPMPLWVWRVRSDSLSHKCNRKKEGLMDNYIAFQKHRTEAFNTNCRFRKIFGEKLNEISRGLFHCKGCRLLAIKILIESQKYDFSIKRMFHIVISVIKTVPKTIFTFQDY